MRTEIADANYDRSQGAEAVVVWGTTKAFATQPSEPESAAFDGAQRPTGGPK